MMKDSDRILAQLLDECANLLAQGESLASCLARYPEYAALLAPLLQPVVSLQRMGAVPARASEVAAARRAQFAAAAAQTRAGAHRPAAASTGLRRRPVGGPAAWWIGLAAQLGSVLTPLRPLPRGLVAALGAIFLVGILATGVVTSSANALPGERLYTVKLATEQARLWLTLNPASRQELDAEIQSKRVSEAEQILQLGRQVPDMPLAGRLEAYGESEWRISGLVVTRDPQTAITGEPFVGALVRGWMRAPGDGSLVATYLQVERVFAPTPTALPAAGFNVVTVTPSSWPVVTVTASPRPTRAPTRRVYYSLPTPIRPQRTSPPLATVVPARTPTPTRAATQPATQPPTQPVVTVAPGTTPTATVTPTGQPGGSPTPQPSALPVETASATPPQPGTQVVRGILTAIGSGRWTIAGMAVLIDGNTRFVGNPILGDQVDAAVMARSDGSHLALEIRLVARAPVATPTSAVPTTAPPTPTAPATGNLEAFSGTIQEIRADSWMVSGQLVYLNANTRLSGATAAVGRLADVQGVQASDGRLVARLIVVRTITPPTATPHQSGRATTPTPSRVIVPTTTSVAPASVAPSKTPAAPVRPSATALPPPPPPTNAKP